MFAPIGQMCLDSLGGMPMLRSITLYRKHSDGLHRIPTIMWLLTGGLQCRSGATGLAKNMRNSKVGGQKVLAIMRYVSVLSIAVGCYALTEGVRRYNRKRDRRGWQESSGEVLSCSIEYRPRKNIFSAGSKPSFKAHSGDGFITYIRSPGLFMCVEYEYHTDGLACVGTRRVGFKSIRLTRDFFDKRNSLGLKGGPPTERASELVLNELKERCRLAWQVVSILPSIRVRYSNAEPTISDPILLIPRASSRGSQDTETVMLNDRKAILIEARPEEASCTVTSFAGEQFERGSTIGCGVLLPSLGSCNEKEQPMSTPSEQPVGVLQETEKNYSIEEFVSEAEISPALIVISGAGLVLCATTRVFLHRLLLRLKPH
eukprot:GHVS01075120.1.p1 GENE.GHVS01075120.1~~GHVS01075120.1.p1  ORF type:complete len:373 (-),score=17.64 GHVS01075120.1:686-1804(-)